MPNKNFNNHLRLFMHKYLFLKAIANVYYIMRDKLANECEKFPSGGSGEILS